jgi:hypothetical protein
MIFPEPGPEMQLEWEDADLTIPLASLLAGNQQFDVEDFLRGYLVNRVHQGVPWGVKSPFLLPYLRSFKRIAGELNVPVEVILTRRPLEDTLRSLERKVSHRSRPERRRLFRVMSEVQEKIAKRWDEHAGDAHIFDIEATWSDWVGVRSRLREIVGTSEDGEE